MNHLVILCHPNPASFNRAIADSVEAVSGALGHDTCCRDLYGIAFNPILSRADMDSAVEAVPQDVRQEQEFISWADMLTFVYPVWWAGMPALLKGYIDRVFCQGFAYRLHADSAQGLLQGKKVLIFNTTGLPSSLYTSQGMHQAMAMTTDTGIFELCGMEVLHHAFFGSMDQVSEEVRNSYLGEVVSITSRYL
jgi:NAD(P)H dehydrogenase (quinone)